mmetsp:Transcript_37018/g.64272  ORF Transcript_37018/g.64272 Transcript_37018/m.64272 type:complete len:439 (-) Transcript_37018:276-1592(-)
MFLSEEVLEKIGSACGGNADCREQGLECLEGKCHCSLVLGYQLGEKNDCSERSDITDFASFLFAIEIMLSLYMVYCTLSLMREYNLSLVAGYQTSPGRGRSCLSTGLRAPVIFLLLHQVSGLVLISLDFISALGIDPHAIAYRLAHPIFDPICLLSLGIGCYKLGVAWIETSFSFIQAPRLKAHWRQIKSLFWYVAVPVFVVSSAVLADLGMLKYSFVVLTLFIMMGTSVIFVGMRMVLKAVKSQPVSNTIRLQQEIRRIQAATTSFTVSFVLLVVGCAAFFIYMSYPSMRRREVHGPALVLFAAGLLLWQATVLSFADRSCKLPITQIVQSRDSTVKIITFLSQWNGSQKRGTVRKDIPQRSGEMVSVKKKFVLHIGLQSANFDKQKKLTVQRRIHVANDRRLDLTTEPMGCSMPQRHTPVALLASSYRKGAGQGSP